jgi:hypothetical protein
MGLKIIPTIESWQRDFGKTLTDVYESVLSNLPDVFAGLETVEDVTKEWRRSFATPVMKAYRETVVPMLGEEFNLPGAFYSTDRFKGVQKKVGEFYSGAVAPTLFEALENMKSRNLQLKSIYASLLGSGGGLATASTQTGVYSGKTWQQDWATTMDALGGFLFG